MPSPFPNPNPDQVYFTAKTATFSSGDTLVGTTPVRGATTVMGGSEGKVIGPATGDDPKRVAVQFKNNKHALGLG